MIGKKLGQYEVLEEVGRGGMGTVYRARQLSLGRDVAIKVLLSHQALDPKSLERFKREGAVVAQVAHPNIVQIIDVGEQDGVCGLAAAQFAEIHGGGSRAQDDSCPRAQRRSGILQAEQRALAQRLAGLRLWEERRGLDFLDGDYLSSVARRQPEKHEGKEV